MNNALDSSQKLLIKYACQKILNRPTYNLVYFPVVAVLFECSFSNQQQYSIKDHYKAHFQHVYPDKTIKAQQSRAEAALHSIYWPSATTLSHTLLFHPESHRPLESIHPA